MVKEFRKGEREQLSENFVSTNFDCQCRRPDCQVTLIDLDLLPALEVLWLMVNGLWLSSGYRCPAHNREEGGKTGSYHLIGKATDVQSHTPAKVVSERAEQIPLFRNGGIGRGATFTHLDCRGYPARWTY